MTIRALDLELHGCGSCGGIWVDGDEDEPAPELDWPGAEKQIVAFFKRFAKRK